MFKRGFLLLTVLGFSNTLFATSGKTFFYIKDHLGSIRATIDQNTGEVVESRAYYPFGKEMPGIGGIKESRETPEKFTGKELDKDTDQYYFDARYYDAELGRWISRDPLAVVATI